MAETRRLIGLVRSQEGREITQRDENENENENEKRTAHHEGLIDLCQALLKVPPRARTERDCRRLAAGLWKVVQPELPAPLIKSMARSLRLWTLAPPIAFTIFEKGQHGDHRGLLILLSGEVELVDEEGFAIRRVKEWEIFGEEAVCLQPHTYSSTAVADAGPVTMACLDFEAAFAIQEDLLESIPSLITNRGADLLCGLECIRELQLSGRAIQRLAQHLTLVTWDAGRAIVVEGRAIRSILFLSAGTVRLSLQNIDCGEGIALGLSEFLRGVERHEHSAVAVTAVQGFALAASKLEFLGRKLFMPHLIHRDTVAGVQWLGGRLTPMEQADPAPKVILPSLLSPTNLASSTDRDSQAEDASSTKSVTASSTSVVRKPPRPSVPPASLVPAGAVFFQNHLAQSSTATAAQRRGKQGTGARRARSAARQLRQLNH